MTSIIAVAIGGAIGAVARYLLTKIPFLTGHSIPWMTFTANLVGALIIGFIAGVLLDNSRLSQTQTAFIKTGFCGGLTTFSTFSLEAFEMIQNAKYTTAGIYILLSVTLCLAGVFAGRAIAVKCFG